MRRGLIIPAAVLMAVTPLFAGCVPSNDDAERRMAAAVVAASPEIDGAIAGYSSSGSSTVLSVKAYIPTAESMSPEQLAGVVQAGLKAVWLASTVEPSFLDFGVVPSPKPDNASFVQQDTGRFPDAGEIIDDDGGTADGSFGFDASTLEGRFGPRS